MQLPTWMVIFAMGKTDTLPIPEFTTESPGCEADYYACSQEQAKAPVS